MRMIQMITCSIAGQKDMLADGFSTELVEWPSAHSIVTLLFPSLGYGHKENKRVW